MTISKKLLSDYIHQKVSKGDVQRVNINENLKPGLRVYYSALNREGTVVSFNDKSMFGISIGVQFGPGFSGHNLSGAIENKNGWWCELKHIELLE